jgi:hypothetical protein
MTIRFHGAALAAVCALAAFAPGQIPAEAPPSPVPQLLELLASDNVAIRREGADGLGAAAGRRFDGVPLHTATPALVQVAMRDREPDVVTTAVAALWRIEASPLRVAATLRDELPALRANGADADTLAELGAVLRAPGRAWAEGTLLPPLLALAEAGPALAALGRDAAAAAPRLRKLLGDVPPAERWRVALALAGGGHPDASLPFLAADDPQLRLAAALAWQRSGRPTLPAPAVVPWLTDPRVTIRLGALEALPASAEVPPAGARAVAELLPDPRFTQSVVACLTRLGLRAVGATEVLLGQLTTVDSPLATNVIQALGAMGSAGLPASDALVAFALAHPEHVHPWTCGQALARIAPARALPRLLEAWREEWARDGDVQGPAVTTLVGMGSATAGELGFVVNLLSHDVVRVRQEALRVLAAMGSAALPALPQVLRLLDDPDRDTLVFACYVLRAIGPPAAPTALPQLQRLLATSADDHVRLHLRLAATTMGDAAESLLLATFDEPRSTAAEEAAKALVTSPRLTAVAAVRIRELMTRPQGKESLSFPPWRVFERPLRDALEHGAPLPPTLLQELQQLGTHPDVPVRCLAAAMRIRTLAPQLAAHRPLPQLVAATPREAMAAALVDPAKLAQWLRSLARGGDVDVACKALLALPLLGTTEDEAGVACAKEILVARSSGKWGAAVAALAAFGLRARSVLPQLIDQLDSVGDPLDWSIYELIDAIRKVRAAR